MKRVGAFILVMVLVLSALRSGDKTLVAMLLQFRGGKLARMYAVGNPDKLVRV